MADIRFGIDKIPGSKDDAFSAWKLTALTFFDPRFATSEDITNVLDLLHAFSGEDLDIILHGYRDTAPSLIREGNVVKVHVGTRDVYYDAQYLKIEVDRIEAETKWKFSLEIDVILVNQRQFYYGDGGYDRNYEDAIVVNLYRMRQDGKISSYAAFFQELIRFSREYHGSTPAWDFSDDKLWRELKKSLFESFKKYLGFHDFQMKVEDYAIKDIRKKRS